MSSLVLFGRFCVTPEGAYLAGVTLACLGGGLKRVILGAIGAGCALFVSLLCQKSCGFHASAGRVELALLLDVSSPL